METSNWSYNEFLALIFIHVSISDFEITEDEQDMINKKISYDDFSKVKKLYKKLNEIEKVELIDVLGHKFCSTQDQRQLVFEDISDIIHANGHKSAVEEAVFLHVKRLLRM